MDQPDRQRRGEALRSHVLRAAKEVFLDEGFERTSMDAVAARAKTSKRSLYAHFENKDALFAAVLELIGELYLNQLQRPEAYADDPVEAVTLFCARFVQLLVWDRQLRACRLCISEAERLPGGSNPYWATIFASTYDRLAQYLVAQTSLDPAAAARVAGDLLDRAALPRLFRALLGVDGAPNTLPKESRLAHDVDLEPIRHAVTAALPAPRARRPRAVRT